MIALTRRILLRQPGENPRDSLRREWLLPNG